MSPPLGPTLSTFYMCDLENNAMNNLTIKPSTYYRYIDYFFLSIDDILQLHSIKSYFEANSVLKLFIYYATRLFFISRI